MQTNHKPTPPTLPRRHAFVVQFSADSGGDDGLQGRVEHVASGARSCFYSPEDLLAFVRQTLARLRAAGEP